VFEARKLGSFIFFKIFFFSKRPNFSKQNQKEAPSSSSDSLGRIAKEKVPSVTKYKAKENLNETGAYS
jgi:hypothetical protein